MIIVCNSCSAQYSVSDAKVRGKLVRITCKHCTTAIVVDGRQMTDVEVASQKPLAGYALPRRDESIVATMPHSLAPARSPAPGSAAGHAPVSAPGHAPVSAPGHAKVSAPPRAPVAAPVPSVMSAALREEDQTMIARSRFGDDMSVHDERTVIGQIPKEALEFERMFAQRTQPPPAEAPSAPANVLPPPPFVPKEAPLPSFASEPPASSAPPASSESANTAESADAPPDSVDDETKYVSREGFAVAEPSTLAKPSSDGRGLVSLAEATHPSVARSASARRLRVTLITVLVLAVLVLLFVIRMPH